MTTRPPRELGTRRRLVLLAAAASCAGGMFAAGPAGAEEATAATALPAPDEVVTRYGVGVRAPRWVSVPHWFLNLFTAENKSLSTFNSYGLEFFGRRGDYDIVLGISYQNMSPEDGNWLGKGKLPSEDTDFVQVRGVALLGADISFVYRKMITDYVGFHGGGGLGLAKVLGEVWRISNSSNCNKSNVRDTTACRPVICEPNGCTEAKLKASEGNDGGPDFPARFKDPDIPGAFPILNLNAGIDFRLPELPGLEARFEGGFYDAFFIGTSFAYVF